MRLKCKNNILQLETDLNARVNQENIYKRRLI